MSLALRKPVYRDWKKVYQSRMVSAQEAVKAVKSGDNVMLQASHGAPFYLMEALAKRKDELEDVKIYHVLIHCQIPFFAPGMEGHFKDISFFIGPNVRKQINDGRAEFIPVHLSDVPRLFMQNIIHPDVCLIQVTPPDDQGFVSLGLDIGLVKSAMASADVVIAMVNKFVPKTMGESFIHVSQIDSFVEHHEKLGELHLATETANQALMRLFDSIGENVSSLIKDGDTLQIGIGSIPDSILKCLKDRKDLGIHTELFSDGIVDLVEAGVVTCARKSIHKDRIVTGFIQGTQRLYDFVDNNPMVEFHPQEYVNDPFVIAQNDNMVAINSAIEIDLTGQVCSDSIGPYFYSGFGGQMDFMRGSARSKGGRPIIAIPSVTGDGKTSRIVTGLKANAGVVTTRADVQYVVTEFGIAQLCGKTIKERARELIRISNPKFQEELTNFAKLHYFL